MPLHACPTCDKMRTDMAAHSSAGAHAFKFNKAADAHSPYITWQRLPWGVVWVEGNSMDRIPPVTEVSEQDR